MMKTLELAYRDVDRSNLRWKHIGFILLHESDVVIRIEQDVIDKIMESAYKVKKKSYVGVRGSDVDEKETD